MSIIIITPPPKPKSEPDGDAAPIVNDYQTARDLIDAAEASGARVRVYRDDE